MVRVAYPVVGGLQILIKLLKSFTTNCTHSRKFILHVSFHASDAVVLRRGLQHVEYLSSKLKGQKRVVQCKHWALSVHWQGFASEWESNT